MLAASSICAYTSPASTILHKTYTSRVLPSIELLLTTSHKKPLVTRMSISDSHRSLADCSSFLTCSTICLRQLGSCIHLCTWQRSPKDFCMEHAPCWCHGQAPHLRMCCSACCGDARPIWRAMSASERVRYVCVSRCVCRICRAASACFTRPALPSCASHPPSFSIRAAQHASFLTGLSSLSSLTGAMLATCPVPCFVPKHCHAGPQRHAL